MNDDLFDGELSETIVELGYAIAEARIAKLVADHQLRNLNLKRILEESHEEAIERVLGPEEEEW